MTWAGTAIGVGAGSAVIGGLSSYLGAQTQADAMKSASSAQIAEDEKALAAYQQALQKSAPMYAPYLAAGTQAQGSLAELMRPGGYLYNAPDMTNFRADPQYKNILNQAMESIRSSRSAKGGLYSGQTDIDLMQQASQLADQAYQSIYSRKAGEQSTLASRLSGMSNSGRSAADSLSALYTGTAGNEAGVYGSMGRSAASGIQGAGEAQASGIMGMGSALQSGIGTGLNFYQAGQNRQNYDALIKALTPQNASQYSAPAPSGGGYPNQYTLPTLSSYGITQ